MSLKSFINFIFKTAILDYISYDIFGENINKLFYCFTEASNVRFALYLSSKIAGYGTIIALMAFFCTIVLTRFLELKLKLLRYEI